MKTKSVTFLSPWQQQPAQASLWTPSSSSPCFQLSGPWREKRCERKDLFISFVIIDLQPQHLSFPILIPPPPHEHCSYESLWQEWRQPRQAKQQLRPILIFSKPENILSRKFDIYVLWWLTFAGFTTKVQVKRVRSRKIRMTETRVGESSCGRFGKPGMWA